MAGRTSAAQVVAANLDTVLVVDALVGETRLRRVERYLAVAWSSGATPVVVLTKADLCDDVAAPVEEVAEDALGVEVLPVSSVTGEGIDGRPRAAGAGPDRRDGGPVRASASPAWPTPWPGEILAETREIRESDGRGRHTTTARELHLLPGGGMLVDTPGMRELGLYDDARGRGHRLRRRHLAGRRVPVPGLRAPLRARLRGRRRPRRRPARPGPLHRLAQAAGRGAPAAAAGRRPGPGRGEGPAALLPPGDPGAAQPAPLSAAG